MKSTQYNELNGREAIERRDELENFITARCPVDLQRWVSAALTGATGLAPSNRAGRPVWAGSELRATLYMLSTLAGGMLLVLLDTSGWMKAIGVLAVVSAMRSLSSAVGHQLTHSSKGLCRRAEYVRIGYDAISALLMLPSYALYQWLHGIHHGRVAGPGDPDQELRDFLGARAAGFRPFAGALLNPMLHARFFGARLRAVFGQWPEGLCKAHRESGRRYDPAWRRALAAMGLAAGLLLHFSHAMAWWFALVVGYQVASLISAVSLHLWGQRPASGKGLEVATATTFGRLLIPEATWLGVLRLPVYAVVRALWLQSDLSSHDIHHAYGTKYPWTEAAYVRTRLLLEGVPLRQTVSIRAMFRVAFESETRTKGSDSISLDTFLQM